MQLDGFEFGKFFDRKPAKFAALPAFFVPAEWKFGVAVHERIHPNRAGPNAAAHRQGGIEVARPDPARQAVVGAVGDFDRFFCGIKSQDGEDRPEDLLFGDGHLGTDLVKNRGGDKASIRGSASGSPPN